MSEIEEGYGGPVWHASVANQFSSLTEDQLRSAAFKELEGVGAPLLGEWHEFTGKAYHIRRRLSDLELKLAGNLTVVDIRDSPDYDLRRGLMQRFLPPEYANWQE